jgi:hypothetical protein
MPPAICCIVRDVAGRPIWCRFCGHPAVVIAGVFPAACAKCDGVGFWSTQPVSTLVKEQRQKKRPRVPYDVTTQDYKLFLRRIRISKD